MKTAEVVVGVRELRTHLSAYLRAVTRGGIVTIGDRRSRPVARLVPVAGASSAEHLAELASRGLLRLGSGKPGSHQRVTPGPTTRTVADMVIEDRR
jgi:prevent-host-death family protein